VLCHPVDLVVFNQKVKISFYTLLQNSKRWYMVITDKNGQSKRREKPTSVYLCSLPESVKGKPDFL